ncbi:MAG TPA: endonuclease/exonuclease/phosphatase family protein [Gemmataceae bacterium]|nr:endonuclease/exonuclease/phosphatase family protein [Gemmataceae bacterium]
MVKIVTINVLFDPREPDSWGRRRQLLVDGLAAEQADLIGLQEVNLRDGAGPWLAEQLGMPHVFLAPTPANLLGQRAEWGLGILSRHPFLRQEQLDLRSQARVAQYVEVEIDKRPLVFCNGHYYWRPGPTPLREAQIRLLLEWLGRLPPETPIVAVGDFNATPDTPEMALMRSRFVSAYAACHTCEPEYTCPTPLRKRKPLWRRLARWLVNLGVHGSLRGWRGTLDYIFVSRDLTVRDCRLILTKPATNDARLYPSDHFGIAAELVHGPEKVE